MTMLIAIATLLLCAANPSQNVIEACELGSHNPGTQQKNQPTRCDQGPTFPLAVAAGTSEEHTPKANAKSDKSYCVSTETLYRWYMWATIAGAAASFVGIGVLVRQSILIRRSTQATERSVKLHENTQRQWVDLKDWHVTRINATEPLDIGFNITNPTSLPLTFHGIIATVDGKSINEPSPVMLITPNDPLPYSFGVSLSREQERLYDRDALDFDIRLSVLFKDSHNIHWRQDIAGQLLCGRGTAIYTISRHDLNESGVPGERGSRDVELPK